MKILTIILTIFTALWSKNYFPRSKEASYLETSDPGIVMIRATGIGIDKRHKKPKARTLDKSANLDARRAAVWFVLYGGSDPLLRTESSKSLFLDYQKEFFYKKNITPFIAWEADYYDSRTRIGKKLKITKSIKVNRRILTEELVKRGILTDKDDIMARIGRPTIMVLPEKKNDISQIDLLKTDSNLKKGAEVIESYLSADNYEVVIPEQQETVMQMADAQFAVSGHEDDFSYLLALSVGSDVYITYTVDISKQKLGNTTLKKASVGCRAYETTTARLLGAETGYSPTRNTSDAVLIEEAMKDAIDKVILRVLSYWEKELINGIQYKLIVKVSTDFDKDESEKILFSINDLITNTSSVTKENIFSDFTLDMNVWCDAKKVKSSTDLYRKLKQNYDGNGNLKKEIISKKLILLQINNE